MTVARRSQTTDKGRTGSETASPARARHRKRSRCIFSLPVVRTRSIPRKGVRSSSRAAKTARSASLAPAKKKAQANKQDEKAGGNKTTRKRKTEAQGGRVKRARGEEAGVAGRQETNVDSNGKEQEGRRLRARPVRQGQAKAVRRSPRISPAVADDRESRNARREARRLAMAQGKPEATSELEVIQEVVAAESSCAKPEVEAQREASPGSRQKQDTEAAEVSKRTLPPVNQQKQAGPTEVKRTLPHVKQQKQAGPTEVSKRTLPHVTQQKQAGPTEVSKRTLPHVKQQKQAGPTEVSKRTLPHVTHQKQAGPTEVKRTLPHVKQQKQAGPAEVSKRTLPHVTQQKQAGPGEVSTRALPHVTQQKQAGPGEVLKRTLPHVKQKKQAGPTEVSKRTLPHVKQQRQTGPAEVSKRTLSHVKQQKHGRGPAEVSKRTLSHVKQQKQAGRGPVEVSKRTLSHVKQQKQAGRGLIASTAVQSVDTACMESAQSREQTSLSGQPTTQATGQSTPPQIVIRERLTTQLSGLNQPSEASLPPPRTLKLEPTPTRDSTVHTEPAIPRAAPSSGAKSQRAAPLPTAGSQVSPALLLLPTQQQGKRPSVAEDSSVSGMSMPPKDSLPTQDNQGREKSGRSQAMPEKKETLPRSAREPRRGEQTEQRSNGQNATHLRHDLQQSPQPKPQTGEHPAKPDTQSTGTAETRQKARQNAANHHDLSEGDETEDDRPENCSAQGEGDEGEDADAAQQRKTESRQRRRSRRESGKVSKPTAPVDGPTDSSLLRRLQLDPVTPFRVSSNECIHFKLARGPRDLTADGSPVAPFSPVFTHQLFPGEEIKGYKDLSINLLSTAGALRMCVDIRYSKTKKRADDLGVLTDKLQKAYCTNVSEFRQMLDEEWTPPGELLNTYTRPWKTRTPPTKESADSGTDDEEEVPNAPSTLNDPSSPGDAAGNPKPLPGEARCSCCAERTFSIFRGRLTETKGLRDFHERLQLFILFFIDRSSFIDSSDPLWELLLLCERVPVSCPRSKSSQAGTATEVSESAAPARYKYLTVGYVTLYRFLDFPSLRQRMRLSQILVLPPFQRQGHGQHLLRQIYAIARKEDLLEVTVEAPAPGMQFLRDVTDLQDALQNGFFGLRPNLSRANGHSHRSSRSGARALPSSFLVWDLAYAKQVAAVLRITLRQVRRVYETVKLACMRKLLWLRSNGVPQDSQHMGQPHIRLPSGVTKQPNAEMQEEYKTYRLEVKMRLHSKHAEQICVCSADDQERKRLLHSLFTSVETIYLALIQRTKLHLHLPVAPPTPITPQEVVET